MKLQNAKVGMRVQTKNKHALSESGTKGLIGTIESIDKEDSALGLRVLFSDPPTGILNPSWCYHEHVRIYER